LRARSSPWPAALGSRRPSSMTGGESVRVVEPLRPCMSRSRRAAPVMRERSGRAATLREPLACPCAVPPDGVWARSRLAHGPGAVWGSNDPARRSRLGRRSWPGGLSSPGMFRPWQSRDYPVTRARVRQPNVEDPPRATRTLSRAARGSYPTFVHSYIRRVARFGLAMSTCWRGRGC
jgi:hypothetical protein